MPNVLNQIIAQKQQEVAQLKQILQQEPFGALATVMQGNFTSRKIKSLQKALKPGNAIIAEIKRASPAKGPLATIADPVLLAKTYQRAGAAAISVLTDKPFFGGSIEDLQQVSHALEETSCVILRKEFIIDEVQIAQAALCGADAVLLIMAVVADKIDELLDFTYHLGLEVLLEVHTEEELELALDTQAKIIGINNRNLDTLTVDLQTSLDLIEFIPKNIITVAESGIQTAKDADLLFSAGFNGLLVGEALVKAKHPEKLIQQMREVE